MKYRAIVAEIVREHYVVDIEAADEDEAVFFVAPEAVEEAEEGEKVVCTTPPFNKKIIDHEVVRIEQLAD